MLIMYFNYSKHIIIIIIIIIMYTLLIVLAELSRLLKERNLLMPNEIHFQLDNCGDNKVFICLFKSIVNFKHYYLSYFISYVGFSEQRVFHVLFYSCRSGILPNSNCRILNCWTHACVN